MINTTISDPPPLHHPLHTAPQPPPALRHSISSRAMITVLTFMPNPSNNHRPTFQWSFHILADGSLLTTPLMLSCLAHLKFSRAWVHPLSPTTTLVIGGHGTKGQHIVRSDKLPLPQLHQPVVSPYAPHVRNLWCLRLPSIVKATGSTLSTLMMKTVAISNSSEARFVCPPNAMVFAAFPAATQRAVSRNMYRRGS